jgi:pimeloyl-ACP methyl ester carboxylesterase
MVYFNGGPGAPSHGIYEYFKENPKEYPLALDIPFLYLDQRGTGCSGELPQVSTDLIGARRMALYGTRNIVRDSDAVRRKLLGGRPWNAFGQSFGGYILHRYMAMFPNSLENVFIHGSSLMNNGTEWVEYRISSQERIGKIYAQQYPADEKTLSEARSIFPSDFCLGTPSLTQCGPGLLDYFGWAYLLSPGGWPGLHASIEQILTPDHKINFEFLKKVGLSPSAEKADSMSDFLVAVVPSLEIPGGAGQPWSCKPAMAELTRNGKAPEKWIFNECRMELAATHYFDVLFPKIIGRDLISISAVERGLDMNPDLKFYLYSGEFDPMVPRESYSEEVRELGDRVQYMNSEKIGHNWADEPQLWLDFKAASLKRSGIRHHK